MTIGAMLRTMIIGLFGGWVISKIITYVASRRLIWETEQVLKNVASNH